ncbi:LysR family transcriptional regulator [Clostridium sp. AM58-1XD]|uniref:LysR family transcriptional regulator n=1 Tax=Clostridium sp. AM58-1XD TaxID=2292307 RepID=UPI000E540875|nr:LysR family transcriptional regulator [Clostridium sp. AM58-1XD]RGY95652.1 LysR family transcriptional regulator [Clostridium sp. AM58-1XD]
MNLQYLKYAAEVEKTGSISQAAENLYMRQPHLSKAVKNLEQELGFQIFYRTGHGIVPTEDGEEFLRHAKEILAKLDEMEQLCSKKKERIRGARIGTVYGDHIWSAFLQFIGKNTGMNDKSCLYEETGVKQILEGISQKKYRLGIIRYRTLGDRFNQKLLYEEDVVCEEFARFPYQIIVKKGHPFAECGTVSRAMLETCPEICCRDGVLLPGMEGSLPRGRDRIEISGRSSLYEALYEAGNAYLWSPPAGEEWLKSRGLAAVPWESPENDYKDAFVYRRERRITRSEERFMEIVKNKAWAMGIGIIHKNI